MANHNEDLVDKVLNKLRKLMQYDMMDGLAPSPYNYENSLAKAKQMVAESTRIVVFTGAGISAESGVSTWRDPETGALWGKFDPAKFSSMSGFEEDPKLVWDWYLAIYDRCRNVKPNPGHVAIGELETLGKHVTVITQNVDDLHECGGSHDVVHLHGDITARCTACEWTGSIDDVARPSTETPPQCPSCGEMARPNVVWFGEMLPEQAIKDAIEALQNCDLCIIVGTSGQVFPAANMPWHAKDNGAKLISINTRRMDQCQYADVWLNGKGGTILPELISVLKP